MEKEWVIKKYFVLFAASFELLQTKWQQLYSLQNPSTLVLGEKKDWVTNSMWQNSYTYIHIPSKIKETNRRSKLKMCICQWA